MQGGSFFTEFRLLWPNGEAHWIENRGYVEQDRSGKPTHCFGATIDITDRKLTEEALKESEQFYRTIFANSQDGFVLIKALLNDQGKVVDHIILKINRVFEVQTGVKAEEMIGKRISQLDPSLRVRLPEHNNELFLKGESLHYESYHQSKNRWYDIYTFPYQENVYGIVFRNITEKKAAEEEIRRSEERFARVFRLSPIIMAIVTKKEARFIDVNHAFEKTFGCIREDLQGSSAYELNFFIVDEQFKQKRAQLLAHKYLHDHEMLFKNAAGNMRIGLANTETICIDQEECFLHTLIDITEQKQMERDISRFDRLHLVGEMAASIGHEIRNPMTSVRGFLQLLGNKEQYQGDLDYFDLMIEELDRANMIITEYLNMAKDKQVDLKPQLLDQVICTLYPIIQSDANRREIDIKLELHSSGVVLIDNNEIKQLVLNLARNVLEAMVHRGTLTIGTLQEDEHVVLYIKDEGMGIPTEISDKLGIPFFTTKEKGTGLGLAICYSIAARHHARISHTSGPAGTTFFVKFPL